MNANEFIAWFAQTSVAVSALVIFILLVRRKVAARFGAGAAYLLWLAPLIRFALPALPLLPAPPRAPDLAAGASVLSGAGFSPPLPAPAADFSLALVIAYAAGAILFVLHQLYTQRRFMTALLATSSPPPSALSSEAAACAARLGFRRTPAIRMAATAAGPLVAGVLRPIIILPAGFENDYARRERELVLAHELTHIRRGDLACAFAALLFRAAQWPNPLVHYAFRAFRTDQEAACDAAVIAADGAASDISYDYGAALVKSAAHSPAAPAASLAMSTHLKERLMLLKHHAGSRLAHGRAVAGVLVLAALAVSASYSHAAAKDPMKAAAPKAEKSTRQVDIFSWDTDEMLGPDGAQRAHRIEVEEKNGVRVVKAFDADGKLLFERPMADAPGDRQITIIKKGGGEKSVTIDGAPDVFAWESGDAEGKGRKRTMHKVIFMSADDDHGATFAGDCNEGEAGGAVFSETDETANGPGEKRIMTQIVCLDGASNADPAKRAEALRKVISDMEESAKREAAQREKMIGKLKAELAKAEREAKKK